MKKVIIFHWLWFNENLWWLPWIKCELLKSNIWCFTPSLPKANKPDLNLQLKYVIDTFGYLLDNETILVWHSLWAILIKKFLLYFQKKVNKLILIWPAIPNQDFDKLEKLPEISKWVPYIKKYVNTNIDEKKILSLVKKYIVLISKNDKYIEFSQAYKYFDSYKEIKIIQLEDKWHFIHNECQTLLNLILND